MSQDNIFREVDEELRSDRMRAMWRRYGPYVIGAAVGVVLIVGVKEGWDWYQAGNAATASDRFYSALDLADGTDTAGASAALNEVISGSHGGYPVLARFKQAELLARDGKFAEAIAAYDGLASSQSNQIMRELALVLAANLLVDHGTVSDVQARVGGLDNPESPLRNAAREALGLAYYKAGDLEKARQSFETITADPLAAADIQGRMQIYLAQLISEGAAPEEEAAETAGAAAGTAGPEAGNATGGVTPEAGATAGTGSALSQDAAGEPIPDASAAGGDAVGGVVPETGTAPGNTVAPANDIAAPANSTSVPGNQTAAPADGTTSPANGTAAPANGTGPAPAN